MLAGSAYLFVISTTKIPRPFKETLETVESEQSETR